jgi:hypothetical protein
MNLGNLARTLKESVRDKRRDRLCADLQAIGVKASLLARRDDREKVPRKRSLGLIEISGSPVSWANLIEYSSAGASPDSIGKDFTQVHFAVLDPRLGEWGRYEGNVLEKLRLHSIKVRNFPVFGQPKQVKWEGHDSGLGIIQQLDDSALLNCSLLQLGQEFQMTAHNTDRSFWLIHPLGLAQTRRKRRGIRTYIDRETWAAIEAIASILLRFDIPPVHQRTNSDVHPKR